mgnify:CR=1 FL=1
MLLHVPAIMLIALESFVTVVSAKSLSLKIILPCGMNPLLSSIPANVFVNTDLPDPDSPTIASVSPLNKSNEIFTLVATL